MPTAGSPASRSATPADTACSAAAAAAVATVRIVPSTGRATARRPATATVLSTWASPRSGSVATISPDRSKARLRLMIISATMAPELPWADSTAARTTRSAGLGSSSPAGAPWPASPAGAPWPATSSAVQSSSTASPVRWAMMPVSVCCRLVPVSESATGNTLIAFKPAAEAVITSALRSSQVRQSRQISGGARLPTPPPEVTADDTRPPYRAVDTRAGTGSRQVSRSGGTGAGSRMAVRPRQRVREDEPEKRHPHAVGCRLVPPAGFVLVQDRVLQPQGQPFGLICSQPQLAGGERHRPDPVLGRPPAVLMQPSTEAPIS